MFEHPDKFLVCYIRRPRRLDRSNFWKSFDSFQSQDISTQGGFDDTTDLQTVSIQEHGGVLSITRRGAECGSCQTRRRIPESWWQAAYYVRLKLASEQWPVFGVEEFPNIEAVQEYAEALKELNLARYVESMTVLGTELQ